MKSIGEDVKKTVAKAGVLKQIEVANVVDVAEKAILKVMKEHGARVRPQYLKNRTLTVSCDSSAVAHQLKIAEPAILEIINNEVEGEKVERIRYLL